MLTHAQDAVWFITGASSGFGRAIADEVLTRGGRVVAAARKLDSLRELEAKHPGRVLSLALDVTHASAIAPAVARAIEAFGGVDVLVNNAGYSIVGAVEETGDRELRETMETMFFGPATLTREILPHMRQRKSGAIVQITSVGGLTTAPGFGAYCAAKHALEALSESLAGEVAPLGIQVLIVEPGAFRTQLFGSAFRRMPELSVYSDTVGKTRGFVDAVDGKQAGDPAKAARAIVEAIGRAPLRLPLGADAVDAMRAKLAAVQRDIDVNEVTARATTLGED